MYNQFIFFVIFIIYSQLIFAEISIKIKKYDKPATNKEIFVKDNFWNIQIEKAPKLLESDNFYIVISGYENAKSHTKLYLKGISFDKHNILIANNTKLEIENKENFIRNLTIFQDKSKKENISLAPQATNIKSFSEPGTYEIVDKNFPWNRVHILVLEKSAVFKIKSQNNFLKIKDIQPGTYSLKIYFGKNWIYQEEFTVMSNSNLSFTYKIKNNEVFRQDISSNSLNKIEFRKNIKAKTTKTGEVQ
jgi:hypothetical protein